MSNREFPGEVPKAARESRHAATSADSSPATHAALCAKAWKNENAKFMK
jgi:hypothetical protein